ncbi:hypothetical protein Adt_37962 [Abeliophyllum distichum]|uniref:Uncharacterized protein n=1 Tax=Abeliophyllum distichum TaxID=126358 RepID=A0ABD1Q501_9LAMI
MPSLKTKDQVYGSTDKSQADKLITEIKHKQPDQNTTVNNQGEVQSIESSEHNIESTTQTPQTPTFEPQNEVVELGGSQDYQLVMDGESPKYQSFNLTEYALVSGEAIDCHEPFTYEEAVSFPKSKEWKEAMRNEMLSLIKK